MALTFTDGRPSSPRTNPPKPANPSENPAEKIDPMEQKRKFQDIKKQQKVLKKEKGVLEKSLNEVGQSWKKTFKSTASVLRETAHRLKKADTIDYQEFIRTIGDVGLDQSDIETIVTEGRNYEVVLTGNIERQLNNFLADAFKNPNFEQLRYESNNWIMSFEG